MSVFIDARLPVRFASLGDADGHAALLLEGNVAAPAGATVARFTAAATAGAHRADCPCCAARSSAAVALSALFLARARGEVAWFGAVVAVCCTPAGEASVRVALASDPLVRAWFRALP